MIKAAEVLLGALLRLGLPLGLTAALVALLRGLDDRWLREGGEGARGPANKADEALLFSALKCWAIKRCSTETQARCPAYREYGRPCWQVFRDGGGQLRETCLSCSVFQKAPPLVLLG